MQTYCSSGKMQLFGQHLKTPQMMKFQPLSPDFCLTFWIFILPSPLNTVKTGAADIIHGSLLPEKYITTKWRWPVCVREESGRTSPVRGDGNRRQNQRALQICRTVIDDNFAKFKGSAAYFRWQTINSQSDIMCKSRREKLCGH